MAVQTRPLSEWLALAYDILVPRTNDNRLNGPQRDLCNSALGACATVRLNVGPDQLVDSLERANMAALLRAQIVALSPVVFDTEQTFTPDELYNVTDIFEAAAAAIEVGDTTLSLGE